MAGLFAQYSFLGTESNFAYAVAVGAIAGAYDRGEYAKF